MSEFGFLLKKLISYFVLPYGTFITLFALGMIFLYLKHNQRAKVVFSAAFVYLLVFSYPPISNALISNIENRYPKYDYKQNVRYIHVLGSGHNDDFTQPLSSMIGSGGMKRILEGIIIHKSIKDSKIVFTGYDGGTSATTADMNARLALALGIDKENLVIEGGPRDTHEEALFMKKLVDKEPFILVTSATHMPRAMFLFKSLGLNPIPAPTDFHKSKSGSFLTLPNLGAFGQSQRAMYEYIGMLWVELKKHFSE